MMNRPEIQHHGRSLRALIVGGGAEWGGDLSALLRQTCPDVVLVGNAEWSGEVAGVAREMRPDLLFVDIEVALAENLPASTLREEWGCAVVFVCSAARQAVLAIRHGAMDCLLLPVDSLELSATVRRAATLVAAAPGRPEFIAGAPRRGAGAHPHLVKRNAP